VLELIITILTSKKTTTTSIDDDEEEEKEEEKTILLFEEMRFEFLSLLFLIERDEEENEMMKNKYDEMVDEMVSDNTTFSQWLILPNNLSHLLSTISSLSSHFWREEDVLIILKF